MLGSYHKRLCDSVMIDDGVIKIVLLQFLVTGYFIWSLIISYNMFGSN